MSNVLVIGLDELADKIFERVEQSGHQALGFDFDVDKTFQYKAKDIIANLPNSSLADLLKLADIIILNIDFSKYESISKSIPFTKNNCLIFNTNICKKNSLQIKSLLQNRADNFLPCNFLLFPEVVIMNQDETYRMSTILLTSNFFKSIKMNTSVLSPNDNDNIFCSLYQIPYLMQKTLFKNTDLYLLEDESKYTNYNFFYQDLLLNKKEITNKLDIFLNNLFLIKDEDDFFNLMDNYNVQTQLKERKIANDKITEEVVLKILIEKVFIKTFLNRDVETYLDIENINFDYLQYKSSEVKKYYLLHKSNIEILVMFVKEKIINLSSLLQFDDFPITKFIRYLNSF